MKPVTITVLAVMLAASPADAKEVLLPLKNGTWAVSNGRCTKPDLIISGAVLTYLGMGGPDERITVDCIQTTVALKKVGPNTYDGEYIFKSSPPQYRSYCETPDGDDKSFGFVKLGENKVSIDNIDYKFCGPAK